MRMTHITQKIIDLLLIEENLTVPQIQRGLRISFGITITQKQIINAVSHNSEILDIICASGQTTVILIPKYKNLIGKNR